jgi:Acetyltransferase (GNAT) domain
MRVVTHASIDELGPGKVSALLGSPVDFSFDVLRAMEKSLWGDLRVRYLAVEEGGATIAFLPVYVGTNINFTAAMPQAIQRAYPWLLDHLGLGVAYRLVVVGSLFSDKGWIPMAPGCDRREVVRLLMKEFDEVAGEEHAQITFVKDLHSSFPEIDLFRSSEYTQFHSLPTVAMRTDHFGTFDNYIQSLSTNGRSHARRAVKKGNSQFTLRTIRDFANLVPSIYPLFRATYLKAKFKLDELSPRFFEECSQARTIGSEVVVCEREGRPVGAYMVLHSPTEQQNKRIGLDYSEEDPAAVYNAMNYHCIRSAVERRVATTYLGQTTYLAKLRFGGKLEDQFLFVKGHRLAVRASLPAQRWWMQRYRSEEVKKRVAAGARD